MYKRPTDMDNSASTDYGSRVAIGGSGKSGKKKLGQP